MLEIKMLSSVPQYLFEQLWVRVVIHKNVKGQESSPLKFLGSCL